MASIFPLSASVGQIFEGYQFNGTAWDIIGIDLTADYITAEELPTVILGIDTVLDGGTAFANVVLTIDAGKSQ
jgi:hypothetical protein